MIVNSVGINVIPAKSGIDKTRVIQQNPISFSGEARPHTAPRATSGLLNRAKAFLLPLGFASSLALPACEGMEELPSDVESSTYINTVTQPDGGAAPKTPTPHSGYQIRPSDERVIEPEYGHRMQLPTDERRIERSKGPQIRPEAEPAIKPHTLEEAGKAVEMFDEASNLVKVSMRKIGKKAVAVMGERVRYIA